MSAVQARYKRMSLDQLIRERNRLIDIKTNLSDKKLKMKEKLRDNQVNAELMKSMADNLLEVISINYDIRFLTELIAKKEKNNPS